MDIDRFLNLDQKVKQKSHFLFGPRQTGKSYLIRKKLGSHKVYNLLRADTFLKLNQEPWRIREELTDRDRVIIIDEIQKIPELLDEAHLLIEEKGVHFLLTGSSPRKLKRAGVNLLGGRARTLSMYPFTFQELKDNFDLGRALDVGLIPSIYLSDDPYSDLEEYAGLYLKEEIAEEAATRNVPAFSRFLTVAGLSNGRIVNYQKMANDAGVPPSTIREYFHILSETLVGTELPPWKKTVKRKPVSTSKFFFFDIGVARYLQHRQGLQSGSPEFGEAFEAFIHHELRVFCDYQLGKRNALCYWASRGFEVDFIVNDTTAIEVKGKKRLTPGDMKGIRALREEQLLDRYIIVSCEDTPRKTREGIEIIPWRIFLEMLWNQELT